MGERRSKLTVKQVISTVCRTVDMDMKTIASKSRVREISDARKIMAHFLKEYTHVTDTAIGLKFGLGHDAIWYYRRVFDDLIKYNANVRNQYKNIKYDLSLLNSSLIKKEKVDISWISGEEFVSSIMDEIDFDEKGTTRRNLMVLWDDKYVNKNLY